MNYNKDVTTRILKKEDIFDGIFVQSSGNYNTIFSLRVEGDDIYYKAVYRIIDRRTKDFKLVVKIDSDEFTFPCFTFPWIETYYSRRLNLDIIRNEKIEELGIYET